MTDLGEAPLDTLRRLYIDENPHPLGDRDQMVKAEERGTYHFRHGSLHPYFSDLAEVEGHYDIFLISLSGDLLYTLEKEDDFATNLQTGPYAGTHLAEVYREALDLAPGETAISDFLPYAPSAGAYAMFVAAPVHDTLGTLVGVVAFQADVDRMFSLVADTKALGATGEAFVLGGDGAFRTPSRAAELFAPGDRPRPAPQLAGGSAVLKDVPMQGGGTGIAATAEVPSAVIPGASWSNGPGTTSWRRRRPSAGWRWWRVLSCLRSSLLRAGPLRGRSRARWAGSPPPSPPWGRRAGPRHPRHRARRRGRRHGART